MSKRNKSAVRGARSSSERNLIHDVSKEPVSSYAKSVLALNGKAKFKREYTDNNQKLHVVVRLPGRKPGETVKVDWVFNPQGENMRQRALARQRGNPPLYPRGKDGHVRFPRTRHAGIRRFPRTRAKRK